MPSPSQGYWWVLEYEGSWSDHLRQIVGFAALTPSNWHQKTGYLCRVGIHPLHQGKGLHKRLIRVRESHAKRLKWHWLVTDTSPDNYASSNSLIRSGYSLYEPWYPWAENKASLYWGKKII